MRKAIIFDFDGVFILSEKPRFKAIQNSAEKHGMSIPETAIKQAIGRTTVSFLTSMQPTPDQHLIDRVVEGYKNEYLENIIEHAEPINMTLDFVRDYTGTMLFGLASMSSRKVVEKLTNHFGIHENFTSIVCKEDVIHHKPDPEIYLKSAKALRVDPRECVAIEDSMVGVQSALNARMDCYILLNGFNTQSEFTNLPIAGFISELQDFENIARG